MLNNDRRESIKSDKPKPMSVNQARNFCCNGSSNPRHLTFLLVLGRLAT